jgi:alcohol dehydrogenase
MRALVFDRELKFFSVHPLPPRKTGEALIKVLLAGICRTDLEILSGYKDFQGVLGHEFVGVVEDASDPSLVGKKVAGEINVGCGKCPMCCKGIKEHCTERRAIGISGKDGCFADYLTLPEGNLHCIPEDMGSDRAIFTEPLAAVFNILGSISVKPTDSVAVVGDGRLGNLTAQVMKMIGADVVVLGHHRKKLSILEWMGIDTCLFLGIEKKEVLVKNSRGAEIILGNAKYDVVVECSGSRSGLEVAQLLVAPRGFLVLKSTLADEALLDLNFAVVNEIRVIGSRCGPFEPAIRAIRRGLVEVRPLISARFPLEDWQAAFEMARKPDTLKIIFEINSA